MTPDHDPTGELASKALGWLINMVLVVAMFFGGHTLRRSAKRHDDIEKRVRDLEANTVTHDDLERLEGKIETLHRDTTQRLDRIFEKMSG